MSHQPVKNLSTNSKSSLYIFFIFFKSTFISDSTVYEKWSFICLCRLSWDTGTYWMSCEIHTSSHGSRMGQSYWHSEEIFFFPSRKWNRGWWSHQWWSTSSDPGKIRLRGQNSLIQWIWRTWVVISDDQSPKFCFYKHTNSPHSSSWIRHPVSEPNKTPTIINIKNFKSF